MVYQQKHQPLNDTGLETYNQVILGYILERAAGKDVRSWSDIISGVYSNVYFPLVKNTLEKQGYTNRK